MLSKGQHSISLHEILCLHMNLGIVVQTGYPDMTQVRPRKLAKMVSGLEDDQCFIFARDEPPSTEPINYAEVKSFDRGDGSLLSSLLTANLPFNPFWILWLILQFRRADVDTVVGSDIRAGFPAIIAARLMNVPVILDLQENNPARQRLLEKETIGHYVTRSYYIIYALEMACVRLADEVWVVVEERKQNLVRKGVPAEKLTVVSNTPLLSEFDDRPSQVTRTDGKSEPFTVIYVGVMNELRGLELAIEALTQLPPEDDDVRVILGGTGYYLPILKRRATELGVEDRVLFPGRIEPTKIDDFLQSGDVGLILNEINDAHETTIPNKLFDYMMVELPVIATPLTPLARLVRETECGIVLPVGTTAADVAEAIAELKHDPDAERYGRNGRTAVEERYNWTEDWGHAYESLSRVVERLK